MTDLPLDQARHQPRAFGARLWRSRHEIVGLALVATIWLAIVVFSSPWGRLWGTGQDAYCYWFPSLADPYARSDWTDPIAYVYSPAFLQLLEPIRVLPWQAFMAVWTGILLAALVYFIMPVDVIPDFLLGLGFTDDMAVLYTAISMIRSHMTQAHREKAKMTLEKLKAETV